MMSEPAFGLAFIIVALYAHYLYFIYMEKISRLYLFLYCVIFVFGDKHVFAM